MSKRWWFVSIAVAAISALPFVVAETETHTKRIAKLESESSKHSAPSTQKAITTHAPGRMDTPRVQNKAEAMTTCDPVVIDQILGDNTIGPRFGISVDGAGDYDNDGVDDFIVGASGRTVGSQVGAGAAYVYSGATGAVLKQVLGNQFLDQLGYSVAGGGDMNNDGIPDVVISEPRRSSTGQIGSVYVYSGQTGALLRQIDGTVTDRFGFIVKFAGDIDSDGYDDIIVGSPESGLGGTNSGAARVYSGQTGALLRTVTGTGGVFFGTSVSGAGDVNNDGYDDFVVSGYGGVIQPGVAPAPIETEGPTAASASDAVQGASPDAQGEMTTSGYARVYSGQTGAVLYTFTTPASDDRMGFSCSGAGDVDGDGINDIVVGAPLANPGGISQAGSVYVYSGQTGAQIYRFDGLGTFADLGWSVAGAGDVNGDGFDDIVAGAPFYAAGGLYSAGAVYVYSGQTGDLLMEFTSAIADDQTGRTVAAAGDVDGNGYPDIIAASSWADVGGVVDAGKVYTFSCEYEEPCSDLGFRPNPEGWNFNNSTMWPPEDWQHINYADPRYPEEWRNTEQNNFFPSWDLFVSVFGEDECYYSLLPEPWHYRERAVKSWKSINGPFEGACYGMALSSYLFYNGTFSLPIYFPGNSTVYDVAWSQSSRRLSHLLFLYQYDRSIYAFTFTAQTIIPNNTLEEVKAMFESDVEGLRGLSMLNEGNGHIVNPYRCEEDPPGSNYWKVYVYDNNHPNDSTKYVLFDPDGGRWVYSPLGWAGSIQWNQASQVGIFLDIPMDQIPADPVIWNTPVGWFEGANRVSQSFTDSHTGIYLQEADSTVCVSASGEIGIIRDSLFSTLSSGEAIIPIAGPGTRPIGFELPDDAWTVSSASGADTISHFILFTDSTVLSYQRFDWQANEVEQWSFNGGNSYLMVHNPGVTGRAYDLEYVADSPDSEMVCTVNEITTAPGESTSIAMTVDEEIQLDNYGGSTTFDLRVRIASNNGAFLFYRDSVEIGAATSQRIIPDWRPNGDSLVILIDEGMTGTYDDTLLVENQGPPCLCLYQGDVNADGFVDAVDLAVVIDIVFFGASDVQDPACPKTRADFNGDGVTDAVDLAILIDHVFFGGAGPTDPCAP